MSWKPEVLVAGDPKWYDNGLRFKTKDEAEAYARDLAGRWISVRNHRAVESTDDWNSFWSTGRAVPRGMHDFTDANGPEPEDAA